MITTSGDGSLHNMKPSHGPALSCAHKGRGLTYRDRGQVVSGYKLDESIREHLMQVDRVVVSDSIDTKHLLISMIQFASEYKHNFRIWKVRDVIQFLDSLLNELDTHGNIEQRSVTPTGFCSFVMTYVGHTGAALLNINLDKFNVPKVENMYPKVCGDYGIVLTRHVSEVKTLLDAQPKRSVLTRRQIHNDGSDLCRRLLTVKAGCNRQGVFDIANIDADTSNLYTSSAANFNEHSEVANYDRILTRYLFKRKQFTAAYDKVNIFLDNLYESVDTLLQDRRALRQYINAFIKLDLYEDQVCSILIYATCTRMMVDWRIAMNYAFVSVTSKWAKRVSDLIKNLGLNSTELGSAMVEASCLMGRGVSCLDLAKDAQQRLSCSTSVKVDMGKLNEAIESILNCELDEGSIILDDIDSFWDSRYLWCVAGAHNCHDQSIQRYHLPRLTPGGKRINKRVVSEMMSECPLEDWSGRVDVRASIKMEHGKDRGIYSCDTVCFYAFSWLFKAIEKAWKGYRVILNPGDKGTSGMHNRICGLSYNKYFLMLDYDDFNSQHSLEAQKMVVRCLLRRCHNMNDVLANKLISSFDNMHLWVQGKYFGRVVSTLMSGHRGTSIINSILNAAYIRLSIGESTWNECPSIHVGDDVLMKCRDREQCTDVINCVVGNGFRLNQSKQSFGVVSYEFLRHAGRKEVVYGYLCRSIASYVSGNWVNEVRMQPLEAINSIINHVHSIVNRSINNESVWELFVKQTVKTLRLSRQVVVDFLSRRVAMNNGPVFRTDGVYEFRKVQVVKDRYDRDKLYKNIKEYAYYASKDYVEDGCSHIERVGLKLVGAIPWHSMLGSSYTELVEEEQQHSRLQIGDRMRIDMRDFVAYNYAYKYNDNFGVLNKYAILPLLEKSLSLSNLRHLLRLLGFNPGLGEERLLAWGCNMGNNIIMGRITYTEARALNNIFSQSVIYLRVKVYS